MILKQKCDGGKPLPMVVCLDGGIHAPMMRRVSLDIFCPDINSGVRLDLKSISEKREKGQDTLKIDMDWADLRPRLAGGLQVFFASDTDLTGFRLEHIGRLFGNRERGSIQ